MGGEQMTTGNGSTGFRDTWLISYVLEKMKTWSGIWNNNKVENGDREDIIGVILEQETNMEERSLEVIFEEINLVKGI